MREFTELLKEHPLPWKNLCWTGQVLDNNGKVMFTYLTTPSQAEAMGNVQLIVNFINNEKEPQHESII